MVKYKHHCALPRKKERKKTSQIELSDFLLSVHTHDLRAHKLLRQHINFPINCFGVGALFLSCPFPVVSTVTCHFLIKPTGAIPSKVHFTSREQGFREVYKATVKHILPVSDLQMRDSLPSKFTIHVT